MIERAGILEQMIINEPGVMDGEDVHHELAGGGHGRKLALKEIPQESDTYRYLIETEAQVVAELYDPLPDVIAGVANSANRIARDIVDELGSSTIQMETEKNKLGQVVPTFAARVLLRKACPDFLLIVEDVGTTGGTVARFAEKLEFRYNIPQIKVLFTWQRQPDLPVLTRRKISYDAVIKSEVKTFKNAKECMSSPEGYCHNGIPLIKRTPKPRLRSVLPWEE